MCAEDADVDRRQCRELKVAESYLRVAYCDGTGHPLRSALWIKVAFAHLWFRTRPGNPHSTRVGDNFPKTTSGPACRLPAKAYSTRVGIHWPRVIHTARTHDPHAVHPTLPQ